MCCLVGGRLGLEGVDFLGSLGLLGGGGGYVGEGELHLRGGGIHLVGGGANDGAVFT